MFVCMYMYVCTCKMLIHSFKKNIVAVQSKDRQAKTEMDFGLVLVVHSKQTSYQHQVCRRQQHLRETRIIPITLTRSTTTYSLLLKKENRSIAFLDTKITRNADGPTEVNVYHKANHTNKYLHFESHQPTQHKRSVARTLLDRASVYITETVGREKICC